MLPALNPTSDDPERAFGYAICDRSDHRKPNNLSETWLTIEQAIAVCCDAIIAAHEKSQRDADRRNDARSRIQQWMLQATPEE